jgi:hypothetical protein
MRQTNAQGETMIQTLSDEANKLLCVVAAHPSEHSAGQSLTWFRAQAGFDELVKHELVEVREAEETIRLGLKAREQMAGWMLMTRGN